MPYHAMPFDQLTNPKTPNINFIPAPADLFITAQPLVPPRGTILTFSPLHDSTLTLIFLMVLPRQFVPMIRVASSSSSCRPRSICTTTSSRRGLERVDAAFAQFVEAFLRFREAVGWVWGLVRGYDDLRRSGAWKSGGKRGEERTGGRGPGKGKWSEGRGAVRERERLTSSSSIPPLGLLQAPRTSNTNFGEIPHRKHRFRQWRIRARGFARPHYHA